VLVTGNARHFPEGADIMSPNEFLEGFSQERKGA
jgi:hypothetical protein